MAAESSLAAPTIEANLCWLAISGSGWLKRSISGIGAIYDAPYADWNVAERLRSNAAATGQRSSSS